MYGTYQSIVDYRLEVCIGGEYTSVCDIGWDNRDAAVVCIDVKGYFEGGKYTKCDDLIHANFHEAPRLHNNISCSH